MNKNHVDNVGYNLNEYFQDFKKKHRREVVKNLNLKRTNLERLRRAKLGCNDYGLADVDELARAVGVDFVDLLLPPKGKKPSNGKFYACCFANNYSYYRKMKGISTYKIAEELGIGATTARSYASYMSVPNMEQLQKLADMFEIDVIELFRLNVDEWEFFEIC